MPPTRPTDDASDANWASSIKSMTTSHPQRFHPTDRRDSEVTRTRTETDTSASETQNNPEDSNELQAGTTIGRYIILARLGSGSMGVVYSAFDPDLDRKIAIKLVKGTRARQKATEHARLLREARALARLNHANVVSIHEAGEVEGRLYLAMEYLEGETLGKWQSKSGKQHRSWREIVEVYVQAGLGLAAAHHAQLVHRDFKPENVMIDRQGRVCVLDFGIAYPMVRIRDSDTSKSAPPIHHDNSDESSTWTAVHVDGQERNNNATNSPELCSGTRAALSENAVALTRIGTVVGTPAYMAPEQLYGSSANAKSDQFSFCVALYETLYGRRPFKGNTPALLAAQFGAKTISFPRNEQSIPRRLRNLIARGLSVDPKHRFKSMSKLVGELRKIRRVNKRNWTIAFGMSLVVAGGTIGHSWSDNEIAACRNVEHELEQIWNQQQRDLLATRFANTDTHFALTSLATVNEQLDEYANRWLTIHRETCNGVRNAGVYGLENQSLKMACLSRRLRSFSTLIQQLLQATPETAEHAWNTSAELAALESCTSATIEDLGSSLPSDPDSLRAMNDLELELANLSILGATEQIELGLEQSQSAVERAHALNYLPLIARSQLISAKFHQRNQDFDSAEQAFKAALYHAEASGDGRITLRAWIGMMGWYVDPRMDVDAAMDAGQHIRALIDRFELHQSQENALFLELLGQAFYWAGNYNDAMESFEQALAIYKDHQSPTSLRSTWGLRRWLGSTHSASGNSSVALDELNKLLKKVKETLGNMHPEVARVQTEIGHVRESMNQDDLALELHQGALNIVVQARGNKHQLSAEILENIASINLKLGLHAKARVQFEKVLAIYRNLYKNRNHPGTLRTYLNLGFVTYEQQQFAESVHWCKKALDGLQVVFGTRNVRIADALSCRAGSFDLVGQHSEALDDYEEALSILIDSLGPSHLKVAVTLEYMGETQWDHEEFSEALHSFKRSREIWRELLPENDPDRVYSETFVDIVQYFLDRHSLTKQQIVALEEQIELVYSQRPSEIIHDRLQSALEQLKKNPSKRSLPVSQPPRLQN